MALFGRDKTKDDTAKPANTPEAPKRLIPGRQSAGADQVFRRNAGTGGACRLDRSQAKRPVQQFHGILVPGAVGDFPQK